MASGTPPFAGDILGLQMGLLLGGRLCSRRSSAGPVSQTAIAGDLVRAMVVQAATFILAMVFVMVNFIVDILYACSIPRPRSTLIVSK